MCTGAEIGLILAATGAGTNALNQQASMRKQDQLTARGLRQQSDIRRKASGRAMEQVDDIAGSHGANEQRELGEAYREALRRSQPGVDDALPQIGAANPRYAEDVAARQSSLADEMQGRAGRLSTIDAAQLQRQREGQRMGRTASDIGQFNDQSQAQDYLTRLRVAAAQPNPWVGGISQLMQGVGSAMAMMPAGAAAGAPATAGAVSPAGLATTPAAGGMSIGAAPWRLGSSNVPWWQNKAFTGGR